jgi:nitrous oxidase accessory protein NosD
VLLVNSNYTSVTGTKVDGTVGYNGNTIKLDNSHYNTLNNTDNGGFLRSIYLVGSTNNVINGVFYRDYSILSNQGIVLNSSSNNVIENCQYISAWDNCIKITQNSNNNILRNNVLNGFTDPNIGRGAGLIISNSVGTEAYNNTITNWPVNLWLLNADNSEFTNNTITNAVPIGQSYYPCLYDSAECPAQILWGTGAYSTSGSTDNTFDQNIIKNNVVHGIWFKEASLTPLNTQILNSNFTATLDSTVCLRKTYAGSTTEDYNNYVSCGTAILSENSEQDPIAYNTFRDSIIGIHFINTINSQIYDNNFINTVRPIVLEGTSGNTFTANTGSGNGIAITGQTSADTFTNNIIGEIPATTVTCGQTLTTSTKLANSLKCSSNGLTLSGDNIFLTCNGKTLTGIRNPTTQQLRGTGVTVQGSNSIVDGCNITGFALAVDLGANPNVMSNDNLSKNAKGVSFVEYLKQTFANIDWDP